MSLEHVATDPASTSASNMGSLGLGKKVMPRSLIISPNLDALLEHEERKRAQNNQTSGVEPGTPDSSQQQNPAQTHLGPSTEIPTGLPPPPRRLKGPKSPISPMVGPLPWGAGETTEGQETTWVDSTRTSSTSNPYINPAPTLDEVLLGVKGEKDRDGSKSKAVTLPPSGFNDNGHHAFSLAPARNENFKSLDMPRTISNKNGDTDAPHGHSSADRGVASNTPWRRRPLISHGHNSSVSSTDSANTSSTHPASTEENGPRISISSTIYQASSDHSHQHIYNQQSSFDMARNSFMDLYSPTNPAYTIPVSPTDTNTEPLSPINFSGSPVSEDSYAIYANDQQSIHSFKPPVPTTPKPIFNRQVLKSRQASPRRATPSPTQHEQKVQESRLPPTTNFLDVEERADLVRKSRKLARVFGQTPGADAMAQQDTGHFATQAPSMPRRKGAAAFNLASPRRHSMPLTPDDVSFLSIVSPTFENHPPPPSKSEARNEADKSNDRYKHQTTRQIKTSSRSSFIDLSDDEKEVKPLADPSLTQAQKTPTQSSPPASLLETMSLDDHPDDERKRKRERLAKLHRFLGSRVPAHLVLGIEDLESSLPPESRAPSAYKSSSSENEDGTRKAWLKRRRSSSTDVPPSSWPEELDRVREDLDDREKALNVRRAQKMEKVFGVAPPLTLYHTRHCPSPSSLPPVKSLPPIPIPVPATAAPDAPASPIMINFTANRSAYMKSKTKKNGRPGTSESSKQLLPKETANDQPTHGVRHSSIYTHYQHSLNSLNDIIDRDDRESLAELHEYLNSAEVLTPKPNEDFSSRLERQTSIASTIKSERRRSLPARTSMISVAGSEYTISTPNAEITTFQVRRRRAAKLTQFFGVNYRELISDVLESIENGVDHEHLRGTLREEEVEDLRSRLRNLKTKRQGVF